MNIGDAKKIVVKVGTSTLTYENGKLNLSLVEKLCRTLSDLANSGRQLVLVTSGAVGVGFGKMGITERPAETAKKQAAAAVGQCELMFVYDKFFGEYNQIVAQVLLTAGVTSTENSRTNVQNTFNELIRAGVIPIVNENDTVDTSELEGVNFGDNDALSAIVAEIVGADLLMILTDTDGLYDKDPKRNIDAKIINTVEKITEDIKNLAGAAGSNRGTGGMATKLKAAEHSVDNGIPCVIINGNDPANIYKVLSGEVVGTIFKA